jgi:hypothetical protein
MDMLREINHLFDSIPDDEVKIPDHVLDKIQKIIDKKEPLDIGSINKRSGTYAPENITELNKYLAAILLSYNVGRFVKTMQEKYDEQSPKLAEKGYGEPFDIITLDLLKIIDRNKRAARNSIDITSYVAQALTEADNIDSNKGEYPHLLKADDEFSAIVENVNTFINHVSTFYDGYIINPQKLNKGDRFIYDSNGIHIEPGAFEGVKKTLHEGKNNVVTKLNDGKKRVITAAADAITPRRKERNDELSRS